MAKRTKFEMGGNEDDYVKQCMKCQHSYAKQEESDILFCSLKECRFKENETSRQIEAAQN